MSGEPGDPLAWVGEELARLGSEGLRRPTRVCRVLPGGRVGIDGRELWNFGSNDYLGLAAQPPGSRDRQGARDAFDQLHAAALPDGRGSRANGATASPAVVGRSPEVAELERTLAEFEGTEDAVVFPTGYAANLGTVAALTGPGDAVFVERDCHACLVDGAKLGGGRLRVWRRGPGWAGGLPKLERELAKTADARRRWIVTDAVFSMDGDAVPLPGVLNLARQYDAVIVMDEAHATGVHGLGGRGMWEQFGIEDGAVPPPDPRVIRTGTLSKAVGAAGGFVSGTRDLCDYLRHAAKSHIFSTALPPAIAAVATANLRWIAGPDGRAARERIDAISTQLTRALQSAFGVDRVPNSEDCPIVPVIVGDPDAAVRASAALAEAGFFVPAIRPPTVRRGTSRLRISLSLAHPDKAIDALGDTLIAVLKDAA